MKISNILYSGLVIAMVFCLSMLILQEYIVPHFGTCTVIENGRTQCVLGLIGVISKEIDNGTS